MDSQAHKGQILLELMICILVFSFLFATLQDFYLSNIEQLRQQEFSAP